MRSKTLKICDLINFDRVWYWWLKFYHENIFACNLNQKECIWCIQQRMNISSKKDANFIIYLQRQTEIKVMSRFKHPFK